ncbi:MAG: hypothetical protein P8Y38_14240, partial [Deltaproteobacteria bacterium]
GHFKPSMLTQMNAALSVDVCQNSCCQCQIKGQSSQNSVKFLAWWSPKLVGQIALPQWRVLFENTSTVKRSDLPWYLKFKLYGTLASWGFRRRVSLLYELRKGLFSLTAVTCHRHNHHYKNA